MRKDLDRSGYGIGDEDFVKDLERELRDRKTGQAQDRDVDYPEEWISADRIDEVVVQEYETTAEALKEHGHSVGAGIAKAVAMELACRLTGLNQRAIGVRYGGISSQAVSHARKRVRTEVSAADLERLVKALRSVPA